MEIVGEGKGSEDRRERIGGKMRRERRTDGDGTT